MLSSLSRRDRRALAAGVLLLGPSLLWKTLIAPGISDLGGLSASLETERGLLQRELSIIASAPADRRSSEDLVASVASFMPRTFGANSGLETRLRALADDSNVEIEYLARRAEESRTSQHAAFRTFRIDLTAISDLEGILTLLGALRTNTRLLVVDEITLEALSVPTDGPETVRLGASILAFERTEPVLEIVE